MGLGYHFDPRRGVKAVIEGEGEALAREVAVEMAEKEEEGAHGAHAVF